jgi:hypothetical protein
LISLDLAEHQVEAIVRDEDASSRPGGTLISVKETVVARDAKSISGGKVGDIRIAIGRRVGARIYRWL